MILFALMLAAAQPDPIAGTWRGTSLCQIKPSACHDEQVVYRVTKTGPNLYRFAAYKIVAGEEQHMGDLDLRLDASGRTLSGANRDRSGTVHPWIFSVSGNRLSGKALTAPEGQIFRLVEVAKR